MPDHLHAVIAFPHEPGMNTTVTNWKKYLAREHGISWQRDFFDHRLHSPHEEMEKRDYILMNPVRKGCCERAEDWPWVYQPTDRPPPQLDYLAGRARPSLARRLRVRLQQSGALGQKHPTSRLHVR